MLEEFSREQKSGFEDNIYAAVFSEGRRTESKREENVDEFVRRLVRLLPEVASDVNKVIQIEVLVALSVEGIINLDNLADKAPMVKAICEMIRMDKEKKATALSVARRLLQ